jgi:putative phosphoribosyl transferase
MNTFFEDRRDAGRRLAAYLGDYVDTPDLLVLALPRGGVPVAYEVARALDAELDVFVVRKLGVPDQPEFAMGAIAGDDVVILDEGLVRALHISREQVEAVIRSECAELERRERSYRGGRQPLRICGRTVLVVDDGLATGASMRAALQVLRARRAARVVVAVPVAPLDTVYSLRGLADDVVCVHAPRSFRAVGAHYRHFDQTGDAEIYELLEATRATRADGAVS